MTAGEFFITLVTTLHATVNTGKMSRTASSISFPIQRLRCLTNSIVPMKHLNLQATFRIQ